MYRGLLVGYNYNLHSFILIVNILYDKYNSAELESVQFLYINLSYRLQSVLAFVSRRRA